MTLCKSRFCMHSEEQILGRLISVQRMQIQSLKQGTYTVQYKQQSIQR